MLNQVMFFLRFVETKNTRTNMDEFGERMKNYEQANATRLMRRIPVIIRVDGRAFHTFTKGMRIPLDEVFSIAMLYTAKELCDNVQGCKFAYVQSDEISLLLTDYDTIETQAWFDYKVQKIVSVVASLATVNFNRLFRLEDGTGRLALKYDMATFDARAFNIPQHEVVNYFIWRQRDAVRNSLGMIARCYFSTKELFRKSTYDVTMMLLGEGVNVARDYDPCDIRGAGVVREDKSIIDYEIPFFDKDREYIERFL